MTEITAISGTKAIINPADFQDAMNLKNAVIRELVRSSALANLDFSADVKTLAAMAMTVDSSVEVYEALWPCLARCLYKDEKITKKTFESVETRRDFYPIALACLKENVSPFFDGLLFVFKELQATIKSGSLK